VYTNYTLKIADVEVAIAEASLARLLQVSHVSSLQNTMVVCGRFGKESTTVAFHHCSSWKHGKH